LNNHDRARHYRAQRGTDIAYGRQEREDGVMVPRIISDGLTPTQRLRIRQKCRGPHNNPNTTSPYASDNATPCTRLLRSGDPRKQEEGYRLLAEIQKERERDTWTRMHGGTVA